MSGVKKGIYDWVKPSQEGNGSLHINCVFFGVEICVFLKAGLVVFLRLWLLLSKLRENRLAKEDNVNKGVRNDKCD